MKINYSAFEKELALRFNTISRLITEDLIRQWFIETQCLSIKSATIEVPYIQPTKAKKKTPLVVKNSSTFKRTGKNLPHADLYIKSYDAVIEFKYHKKSPYSATCKTTNMGKVFRDLNRLSTLNNEEKYFIYVFDQEMKDYYDKHVFDILKVDTNIGKVLNSSNIETLIKGTKTADFKNAALSSFDKNIIKSFNDFNYTAEVLYSNNITTYKQHDCITDNFYIIILQVK